MIGGKLTGTWQYRGRGINISSFALEFKHPDNNNNNSNK